MDKDPKMDEYLARLKKLGLKVTPQRLAVHKAMLKLGHASADMVAAEIMKSGNGHTTVASVYNILSQLSSSGIYQRRMSSNSKMYFDSNTSKHIHLYDTVNHVHNEVKDDETFKAIESMLTSRRFKGYKIDGVDIQILAHPTGRRRR